jgi:hypothetical protein
MYKKNVYASLWGGELFMKRIDQSQPGIEEEPVPFLGEWEMPFSYPCQNF